MHSILQIEPEKILPPAIDVLIRQGIPVEAVEKPQFISMANEAVEIFEIAAEPTGIIRKITVDEFEQVFIGEKNNEANAPLKNIFPNSINLTLFAVTMGSDICNLIENLLVENNFANGYMLDTVASLAADKSVEFLESHLLNRLTENKMLIEDGAVLAYSPGYCGWHISGQKKLFAKLQPDKIGITLNNSFLMSPIKSVTGVIIYGKIDTQIFENNFDFCELCKPKSCTSRFKKLMNYRAT